MPLSSLVDGLAARLANAINRHFECQIEFDEVAFADWKIGKDEVIGASFILLFLFYKHAVYYFIE